MKAWSVVGYTYKADILCPACVLEELEIHDDLLSSTEMLLTKESKRRGIDYSDESSYDSDNWPKVIFASQDEGEHCARCHEPLIDSVFD